VIVRLDPRALGRSVEGPPQRIEREQIRRFAAATLDTHPGHLSGLLAPIVFSVLPTMTVTNRAIIEFVGIERPEDYPGLHGEHWIDVRRPLTAGMVISTEATVVGVRPTRAGTTVTVRVVTFDPTGDLLNEQYFTSIMPGVRDALEYGVGSPIGQLPSADPATWRALPATFLPTDLPTRYADVSGDHHPYHLDAAVARAAGLPGVILHGVCALAVASTNVVTAVCSADPTRLVQLGVRFARPVVCGRSISTRLSPLERSDQGWEARFEVIDPDGNALLKHGSATIRP
jgi:acyl dehydratase